MDSAWIAYNKPKSPELANEYAGFLMALGLNGHLTKLATLNIHDYLTKVHTPAHNGVHLQKLSVFVSNGTSFIYLFTTLKTHLGRHTWGLVDAFYLNAQFILDSALNYCYLLQYKCSQYTYLNTVYTKMHLFSFNLRTPPDPPTREFFSRWLEMRDVKLHESQAASQSETRPSENFELRRVLPTFRQEKQQDGASHMLFLLN